MEQEEIKGQLEEQFRELTAPYVEDSDSYFDELWTLYTQKSRYYHDFRHIADLLALEAAYGQSLKSPETVRFAIWYHDAIYNGSRSDNEEKSAQMAEARMTTLGVAPDVIQQTASLIRATASHVLTPDVDHSDGKFFMDIDLAVLARPREVYATYMKQVRQEYKMYPDLLYKPGRKKVLRKMLEMPRIYKTDLFHDMWETKARENLAWEIG